MDEFEAMLDKAHEELPEQGVGTDRFNLEKVKGHLEGNKTVISNIKKIAKDIGRSEDHLLKYLLRELASPGKIVGELVIFGTKIPATSINKKIKKYVSEFVYCSECGKPDTTLSEEKSIMYLKCSACGVKKPVKQV